MSETSRRQFLKDGFTSLVSYSFLHTVYSHRLLARPVAVELENWVSSLNGVCRDLRRSGLGLVEWQQQIEILLEQVSLEDLLRFIDFEVLERQLTYPDLGVDTTKITFPGFEDIPNGLHFFPKLFGMEEDRAIIPHGHRNMVSAHLVIGGRFHLRQFDRRQEEANALVVEPTVDAMVGPGEASSISDDRDNIHWLIARGGRAYTLDVIVSGLSEPGYGIDNLDPDNAETLDDGLVRMPKLSVAEALERYGKDHHDG